MGINKKTVYMAVPFKATGMILHKIRILGKVDGFKRQLAKPLSSGCILTLSILACQREGNTERRTDWPAPEPNLLPARFYPARQQQ